MNPMSFATILARLLLLVLTVHSSSSFVTSSTVNKQSNNDTGIQNNMSSDSEYPKIQAQAGKIEELKQREAALSRLLGAVRLEKLEALRSRPLTIGVVGFGRFGQFIARTFSKHGKVVATSRSDYTELASGMGVDYIPLSDIDAFLESKLDE